MSDEKWLSAVGYEGFYEVSDEGRVRSVDRVVYAGPGRQRRHEGRVLATQTLGTGYASVRLWKHGMGRTEVIHQLVLATFVGERPDGHEGCHKDGVRTNGSLRNLYWGTHAQNVEDMMRHRIPPAECQRGHVFDEANTITGRDGRGRRCRKCRKRGQNAWYRKKREGAAA